MADRLSAEYYHPLEAVSPVDGRYRPAVQPLAAYFSESAFFRYRIKVEVEYLIALAGEIADETFPPLDEDQTASLRKLYTHFSLDGARAVKDIERTTRHDIKAVEYYLRRQMESMGLQRWIPLLHLGLTSQDVNHPALTMMWRDGWRDVLRPALLDLETTLKAQAQAWADMVMLSRTHGQPASPTTLGKEVAVFAYRLRTLREQFDHIPLTTKFGGAVGNFNAHLAAWPEIDWEAFADRFIHSLGLERQPLTTQIENYDLLGLQLKTLASINTVLLDAARDFWLYISIGYFSQRVTAGEVGSSTMPHKVNPIDFENAEGNLGLANAVAAHIAGKLPVSRWQRDLSDSTVTRNLGVPAAYSLIAYQALSRGFAKVQPQPDTMAADLERHPEVLGEAVQTYLRKAGRTDAYELVKDLTRGKQLTTEDWQALIEALPLNAEGKAQLRELRPGDYVGLARTLVRHA